MAHYDPKRDNILHMGSPEELHAFMDAQDGTIYGHRGTDDVAFSGETGEQAIARLRSGDPSYIAGADALVETMKTEGLFCHGQKVWETAVIGAVPCVPNVINDLPDTMWSVVETDQINTTTPIRIYVVASVSAGVSQKEITARGYAILGLVMALKNVRPVELYSVALCAPGNAMKYGTHGAIVRIETNPLDVERAAYILCASSYMRQIKFALATVLSKRAWNDTIQWPWDLHGTELEKEVREFCGMTSEDVYIDGTYMSNTAYRSNPVAWIKQELAKLGINSTNEH